MDSILVQDRLNTVDQKLLNTDNGSIYHHLQKANMRLAEDRVLSFIIVFGTGEFFHNISIGRFIIEFFMVYLIIGMGTKWVPGATFMYEPEISFYMWLEQR